MAVTKQTYTLSPTWTAAQHADLIRQMFIDAGLMTEWYDSFLSGTMENRILEVQYDASKTYGKTYYWFIFNGGVMYLSLASGWNAGLHIPTGTQYLDYYSTTTNAATNHFTFYSWSATTTLTVTRYQSNVDSNFSWFFLRNGSATSNFHIAHPSVGPKIVSWIDLNKVFFHHLLVASLGTTNTYASVRFKQYMLFRRSYHPGAANLNGLTSAVYYYQGSNYGNYIVAGYIGGGNASGTTSNIPTAATYDSINEVTPVYLPIGFNSLNPAYTSNSAPVFTGAQYSHYLFNSLPSDFGIAMHYANNTMATQDTLVVSSGTEEWEMINVANNATVTTGASAMFLARTVG